MKAAIERKLISGIVIAIVCVLAIVVLSIFQSRRLQDQGAIVKHTNQVLYLTDEILDISRQHDLGVKDFQLTGDSVFLNTARSLTPLLEEQAGQLKALTADNGRQQVRIDSLLFFIHTNESAKLVAVIGQIKQEERQLLEERRATSQRGALELQIGLWTLIAVVAILALVTFFKVRIDLIKEKKAHDELNRFNFELAAEVQRQTHNLKLSEEKYKALFYRSQLPIWIYDLETMRFLEVNDGSLNLYGYTQEEFLGLTLRDICLPEDGSMLEKDVGKVRQDPQSQRYTNWRHVKKNGDVVFVELTSHAVEYERRAARMVVVIDVTERRKTDRMLQQLNDDLRKRAAELAASNGELERFAYIASHDLQEPLRMVTSFLQLLQKRYGEKLDAKADQYIKYAVDGSERMKALIMDLLEYSRVGTGTEGWGAVSVPEVVAEVREIFREKIIEQDARIEVGPLPRVWGDKVQLTQLFQNLVGNALKYHSDRPVRIDIQAKEEGGYWTFEVRDNGIGIDPQFFEKIFIIFQRLHNKNDYSGTGIGLAICKKIIERHGGRIWLESTPGEGSTFLFTIAREDARTGNRQNSTQETTKVK